MTVVATDKQMAANRKNALKSTGPRTPEGKGAVRYNALQHGLLAQAVFIGAGAGREDSEEYAALLTELREALQPEGRLELIMVEKIAVAYWRLCRAGRAEVGAVRRVVDELEQRKHETHEEALRRDLRELSQDFHSLVSSAMMDDGGPSVPERLERYREDLRRRLRKNPLGVRHLLATVDAAMGEIRDVGKLSETLRSQLEREFPDEQGWRYGRKELEGLLVRLREERQELEHLVEQVERREAEALEVAQADASLPGDGDMARIHRYETMYERQLYQAMQQLERLQRRRLGELSVPPISVSVSRED
jgi:hypothetical protein